MSDETPERLRDFRDTYSPPPRQVRDGGHLPLLIVTVLGFATVIGLLLVRQPAAIGADTADMHRQYAAYLAERHLYTPAIEAYARYLEEPGLDAETRHNVSFRAAELAIEAEDYETALAYLYRAEMLKPESGQKAEIDKAVALCLDKLGRNVDLRRELRERTAAHRDNEPGADEVVLAEFAGETITDRDLEIELEQLPPAAREQFATPDQQAELLRNMVAERLLIERAQRLGLDEDQEVREQLDAARESLMVRRLIDTEVAKTTVVTPQDVERFYKAEIARFTEPASATVRVARAETREAAEAVKDFPDTTQRVVQGAPIPGLKEGAAASDAIFNSAPGEVVGPFESTDGWRVFELVAATPAKVLPLEQVRSQAERMLRAQKQQEAMDRILAETLEQQDVRLYPERIAEAREQ